MLSTLKLLYPKWDERYNAMSGRLELIQTTVTLYFMNHVLRDSDKENESIIPSPDEESKVSASI